MRLFDATNKRHRELHKVYTNGTLVDEELLTDDQAGHCISIREGSGKDEEDAFGICVLDSSTSEFNLSAFTDDVCRTKLETMLRQLRPKEILFTKVNQSAQPVYLADWSATTGGTVRFDHKASQDDPTIWMFMDDSARCRGVRLQDHLGGIKEDVSTWRRRRHDRRRPSI